MDLLNNFFSLIANQLNTIDKTRSFRASHVCEALNNLYGKDVCVNKWPIILFTQSTTLNKIYNEMRRGRIEREKVKAMKNEFIKL